MEIPENTNARTEENCQELLLQACPFGIQYYTLENERLVYRGGNTAGEKYSGIKNEQCLGRDILDVLPELIQSDQYRTIIETAQKETAFQTRQMRYGSNGIDKAAEIRVIPLGEKRIAVFIFDVTEYKRGEDILQEQAKKLTDANNELEKEIAERKMIETLLRGSEKRFSEIFHASPDPIIIERFSDGQFIDVNEVFTESTGYARSEVVGRTSAELNLWVHDSDRVDMREQLKDRHAIKDREYEFLLKNGSKKTGSVSAFLIEQEGAGCVLSVVREAAQQRRNETASREKENELQYKEFFENDLSGDFICTIDGKLIDCNPAFISMFGYDSREEALKANVIDLYPAPESFARFVDLLKERKKLSYYELELKSCSGKLVSVVQNTLGVYDKDGELVGIRAYLFNDTERRQLELQLRQAQKMDIVGTLASGIAHDFNNILNNIIGFANQIRKHAGEGEKVQRYCETIEKSASRGAQIANQLLVFTKKKNQEEGIVDITGIIQEITALARETFPRSIEIRENILLQNPTVYGDKGAIYEILLNLCINARDAMPSGGVLSISASNGTFDGEVCRDVLQIGAPSSIEIMVQDTGSGISQDIQAKIYDPFFTTKERGKGTGLGLSIVYNAVKNHHGSIHLESAIGKGSIFTVCLPAYDEPEKKPEPFTVDQPTYRGNGELILLVDDEEPMQLLGKELLEEYGYRVLIASNGQEAVDIYKEKSAAIGLVILDLIMPVKDGGQAYLEIKELNKNVKAIFCSGFTSEKVISQLLQQENLIAIQKPFNPDDFIRAISTILHK